ncbi:Integrin Beta-Like Protein 1 [Manis pentadactyla]|nr:Integrin Beta-Like Protein 1 [Manis pentadactyla]
MKQSALARADPPSRKRAQPFRRTSRSRRVLFSRATSRRRPRPPPQPPGAGRGVGTPRSGRLPGSAPDTLAINSIAGLSGMQRQGYQFQASLS